MGAENANNVNIWTVKCTSRQRSGITQVDSFTQSAIIPSVQAFAVSGTGTRATPVINPNNNTACEFVSPPSSFMTVKWEGKF